MADGNRALTDGKKEEGAKKAQMEVKHLYFDADLWNVTRVQIRIVVKDVEK